MMTASQLKRESFRSNPGSMSVGNAFDSSFDSSASTDTPWDQCYTPTSQDFSLSRRQSSGSIDMDALSSSRSSLKGSISPAEQMFFPITSMASMNPNNMLTSLPAHETNFLFAPSYGGKGSINPNFMNFDFSNFNAYGSLESPDFLSDIPTLSFDSSSPLPLGSSPQHYVVPSQTTFGPPFPLTPTHVRSNSLGSPADFSLSRPTTQCIEHFMSPANIYTPCRTSTSKTASLQRTPRASTLEASMNLHRVQSIGTVESRVRKAPRKQPQIDCVAAGRFFCDFEGCKSKQQGFRRQEHLKRHKKTHLGEKTLFCCSCDKVFGEDRSDNFIAHVKLHTIPDKKNSRTKYCLKAVALVKKWEAEKARKGSAKKVKMDIESGTGRITRASTITVSGSTIKAESQHMDF